VNLTIREYVLNKARFLKLKVSQTAETSSMQAIKEARGGEWLEANKAAISAHNAWIEKQGTLLKPSWSSG
jgi:post-segregation antitoxin (ccd killing protein)